jgi:hypothetical protein
LNLDPLTPHPPRRSPPRRDRRRTREIVSYAIAADHAGLDVFGLGEHHSWDFAVATPPCRWPRSPRPPAVSGCQCRVGTVHRRSGYDDVFAGKLRLLLTIR